jgi:predicted adenine nucleotide alpha hydrolase (AANH) superfamily ATPase
MAALFKIPARVSRLSTLDQIDWLQDCKKSFELSIKAAQQRAVEEGLAEFVTVDVERVPNKATFIAEFGEKVFARMCTRSTRTDWRKKS